MSKKFAFIFVVTEGIAVGYLVNIQPYETKSAMVNRLCVQNLSVLPTRYASGKYSTSTPDSDQMFRIVFIRVDDLSFSVSTDIIFTLR